jgi:hypothetical protein
LWRPRGSDDIFLVYPEVGEVGGNCANLVPECDYIHIGERDELLQLTQIKDVAGLNVGHYNC